MPPFFGSGGVGAFSLGVTVVPVAFALPGSTGGFSVDVVVVELVSPPDVGVFEAGASVDLSVGFTVVVVVVVALGAGGTVGITASGASNS